MLLKVALIYNEPAADRYQAMGESKAELGVIDEFNAVREALSDLKYSTVIVPLRPPLEEVKKQLQLLDVDVVFNLFEGFDGCPQTEGQVAAMLVELKIPFTGCPPAALALALDKSQSKGLMVSAGIPTPRYVVLSSQNTSPDNLKFPCIVKPVAEDASHGVSEDSVVNDRLALEKQIKKISALFGDRVLVEEYIEGREFNIAVIGEKRLTVPAVSEIVYTLPPGKPRILTFESKWEEESIYFKNTRVQCPANITEAEYQKIVEIAKATFRLMGCRGYARVDFRQDREGNFFVLEVNPNPDITPESGVARQICAAGIPYSEFIDRQIKIALKVGKRDENPPYDRSGQIRGNAPVKEYPEFLPDEVDLAEEVIDDYLEDPKDSGYNILVAEENGALSGYLVYGPVPISNSVWEMYWFAVDRSLRGKGIGRQLWEYAEQKVWEGGGKFIVLETSSKAEYDRTNQFYLRGGYTVCGHIKDFYMPGDDQITYLKRK